MAVGADAGVLADVAGEAATIGALPWELVRRTEADVAVLGYLAGNAVPTGALVWELERRVLGIV